MFQLEVIVNVLVIARSDSFECLCYGFTKINILILAVRGRLYTSESEVSSESEVYRRQILTYKDGLRAERVS